MDTEQQKQARIDELRQKQPRSAGVKSTAESIAKKISKIRPRSEEEVRAWEQRQGDIKRKERAALLWQSSKVPSRHVDNLGNLDKSGPWMEAMNRIDKRLGAGTLMGFLGKRGTGKTQMAVACIWSACKEGRTALYTTAAEMFQEIKSTYSKGGSESGVMGKLGRLGLLVIDELHERANTDWEDRVMVQLVDKRYRENKDTIIVSNLLPDKFRESVGPSINSRMIECGGTVRFEWESFRG